MADAAVVVVTAEVAAGAAVVVTSHNAKAHCDALRITAGQCSGVAMVLTAVAVEPFGVDSDID